MANDDLKQAAIKELATRELARRELISRQRTNPDMQGGAKAPANIAAQKDVRQLKLEASAPFTILTGLENTANQISKVVPFGDRTKTLNPLNPQGRRNIAGESLKLASFAPGVGPAVGGASYMAGQAVEDPKKSAGGVALQAGIGGALGGVAEVATPFVGKAIKAMVPKSIEDKIFNLYNEAIGTRIKQPSEAMTVKASKVNVVKTISDNLPNIKLPNLDTGVLESRIPKTREENLLAFQQAKDLIWKNNVTKLSQGATAKGAQIDLGSLVDQSLKEAKANIGSVALKANPGLEKALDSTAKKIKDVGSINPTQSQEYLKYLNDQIQSLRKSGQAVDFSRKDLLNSLRYNLAEKTDNVIEETLGQAGYKEARKQYSDLRGAQSEILAAANKYLRQQGGGGGFIHPIVNLWSLEEILQSAGQSLVGNIPAATGSLARAAAVKSASKIVDFMRSPDRKIAQMYELASKYQKPFKAVKAPLQLPYSGPTLTHQPFKNIKFQE